MLHLQELAPIPQDTVFNTVVLANTDLINDVTITQNGVIRASVSLDTAAIFRLVLTRGGVDVILDYNSGNNLIADSLYMFDFGVRIGDIINFQVSAGLSINVLNCDMVVQAGA